MAENVRHRIDGLEICARHNHKNLRVRHRIDGLEILPDVSPIFV